MSLETDTSASTGGVEDMSFDSLDFSDSTTSVEPKEIVDDEPVEEVESTEGKEEATEESSDDEPVEEPKPEEPSEEFKAVQAKAEKAERKLKKAIERIRDTEAKVAQAEAHILALKGEGLDASLAKEIVVAKKSGNFGKVWEMLGFDANEVVKSWSKSLGWTKEQEEEVQIHVKRKQMEEDLEARRRQMDEEKARVEQDRARTVRQDLNLKAERFAQKMADKFPVISTLEDKAVDQLRETVAELVRSKDPRVQSCKTFEDALRIVAPMVEKKLYKESLRAYEAVKKIKERKPEKEASKSTEQKKEPTKSPTKVTEQEDKGSAKQGNSKPAPTPKSKLTEKERLDYELAKLDFSGK
jgi:hypothetical protein